MKLQNRLIGLRIAASMALLLSLIACSPSANSLADQPTTQDQKQREATQGIVVQTTPATKQIQREISEQGIKLYPVDEGSQDRSFEVFRQRLLEATRKRDSNFILSILDLHIKNSFGGDGGVDEFKEQWKLDQTDSELWEELIAILSNGGSFMNSDGEEIFCAPYVYSQWEKVANQLPDSEGTPDYVVIIGENVDMRREPSPSASIIATLSYNVVKVDYDDSVTDKDDTNHFAWIKITTLSGKQGYVAGKYVSSPSAYRACFKKEGEKWVMTALVAGD